MAEYEYKYDNETTSPPPSIVLAKHVQYGKLDVLGEPHPFVIS